jgi:hypothetical protein
MQPNTLGLSGRGRHIHSTFPDGATRAFTSQSERNAYWAIGGNGLRPAYPSCIGSMLQTAAAGGQGGNGGAARLGYVAEEDLQDPTVSAVVTVLPRDQRTTKTPESGVPLSEDLRAIGLAKSRFTSAGFEVHAPFTGKFSIGARRSLFEEFFGEKLLVDDSQLIRSVTNSAGGVQLPLDRLPDDLKGLVGSVEFTPPPDFARTSGGTV